MIERRRAMAVFSASLTVAVAIVAGSPPSRALSTPMLTSLIKACAAPVSTATQTALVDVESGEDSWALHDDNSGVVYHPRTLAQAERTVSSLLANDRQQYGSDDRGVDIGLGQINRRNLGMLHTNAFAMLDPCRNLRASSSLLADAYTGQRRNAGTSPTSEQAALSRALQIYNSGRPSGDQRYVDAIYAAAMHRNHSAVPGHEDKQSAAAPATVIVQDAPAVFVHVDRSAPARQHRPIAVREYSALQAHGSAFIETPVASLVHDR